MHLCFFFPKSQILFKQKNHFHVNYTKEKKREKKKEKSHTRKKLKKKIKISFEDLDCATKARCGLRPSLCPELDFILWFCAQLIMTIMVLILLTFQQNKEGRGNKGKCGCCRKSICDSADGKRLLARESAFKNLSILCHPKISLCCHWALYLS